MRRFILAATAAALVVAPAGLATAEASAATGGAGAAHVAAVNWPTVRPGARGEVVRTIQYLLKARGINVAVDGTYGNSTTAAVKNFQKAVKVSVDGRVGPGTWPKLVMTIKRGDRGNAVLAVERWLRLVYGYKAVGIDSVFGPRDQATIKNVQFNHGLRTDGIVGAATWKVIVIGK